MAWTRGLRGHQDTLQSRVIHADRPSTASAIPRVSCLTGWLARGVVADWLDNLILAITDPVRREYIVPLLMIVYVLLWTIYAVLAKGSQDIHFDMGETVVWSRNVTFGTPKHPPFSAWLSRAWFDIFPCADWAFYLLAMTMAGVALWCAWRLSMQYLSGDKLALATVLLTFVPFYNFHALKFNANTVMIPLWALATWSFVHSFRARTIGWAALAGIAAAGVMLGKYWGIFLLLGFGLAALIDPRRRAYFRSAAPWVSIAVGLLALAPHLVWIVAHRFVTFTYAMQSHYDPLRNVFRTSLEYIPGAIAYAAIPILITLLATRPDIETIGDTVRPGDPDRRLALSILVLPLVAPPIAGIAAHSGVTSLWTMGGLTLLPAVLLSSPLAHVSRLATRRVLAIALAAPFLAIAAAPVAAFLIHLRGPDNHMAHYRLLANAVEHVWHETTPRPLSLVGGEEPIINGIAFYAADAPSTLDIFNPGVTPWGNQARIERDGIAWICPASDLPCMKAIAARIATGPVGKRLEISISRTYLGIAGAPERYLIVTTPPR